MRELVAFAFLASIVYGEPVRRSVLVTKNGVTIKSPKYPEQVANGTFIWTLQGFAGSKITVLCDDVKVTESENCMDGNFFIRDDTRKQFHCGDKTAIGAQTTDPSIKIFLELKGAKGSFKCKAKLQDLNQEEPINEINIKQDVNSLYLLSSRSTRTKVKTWVLTANPGLTIKLLCERIRVYSKSRENKSCDRDYLALDLGDDVIKECGSKWDMVYTSAWNKMTVRLVVPSDDALKNVQCIATATKGHLPRYFKDVPSEEVDSSEHGRPKGTVQTTCDCGRANKKPKNRIIYGKDADENEFPWIVSLQWKEDSFHFCGGSILTPRHVISAAHCTVGKKAEDIVVVAGVTHLKKSKGGQVLEVKKIIDNEEYEDAYSIRDISILITAKIKYSRTIGPICIPKWDPKMVGEYVTAVGWGNMAADEDHRDRLQLQKTHMRVIDPSDCLMSWPDQFNPEVSQICTWSNHTDVCFGDSGGPVAWVDKDTNRYFLVGLPAYCDGCRLMLPSIHTAVYYYSDWIQNIISNNMHPNERICTKIT